MHGVEASLRSSLHGFGAKRGVAPLEEQLRAGAGHNMAPHLQIGAISGGLRRSEVGVKGLSVTGERRRQRRGEVALIGSSGSDGVFDQAERTHVLVAAPTVMPVAGPVAKQATTERD